MTFNNKQISTSAAAGLDLYRVHDLAVLFQLRYKKDNFCHMRTKINFQEHELENANNRRYISGLIR